MTRGQLVALTGHSNAGKTAIALKLAFCVALGLPFGRLTRRAGQTAGQSAQIDTAGQP